MSSVMIKIVTTSFVEEEVAKMKWRKWHTFMRNPNVKLQNPQKTNIETFSSSQQKCQKPKNKMLKEEWNGLNANIPYFLQKYFEMHIRDQKQPT